MKTALIALTVAITFTAPAPAGIRDAKNRADCEKGGRVVREEQQVRGEETALARFLERGMLPSPRPQSLTARQKLHANVSRLGWFLKRLNEAEQLRHARLINLSRAASGTQRR